jgi:hypothetical protein
MAEIAVVWNEDARTMEEASLHPPRFAWNPCLEALQKELGVKPHRCGVSNVVDEGKRGARESVYNPLRRGGTLHTFSAVGQSVGGRRPSRYSTSKSKSNNLLIHDDGE